MVAATAVTLRLPVSCVILVGMLLSDVAMMPAVIPATVVAFVIIELLPSGVNTINRPFLPIRPDRVGKRGATGRSSAETG